MNSISTYIDEETLNMYYDRMDDIVESAFDEINEFNGVIFEDAAAVRAMLKEKAQKLVDLIKKFVEIIGNIIEKIKAKVGAIKTKAENYVKAGKTVAQDDFSFVSYETCEKNANTCKDTLNKIQNEMIDPLSSGQDAKNEASAYRTIYDEIDNIGALDDEGSKARINVTKGENLSAHIRAAITRVDNVQKEMANFRAIMNTANGKANNMANVASREGAEDKAKALLDAFTMQIKFANLGVRYCNLEIKSFDAILKHLEPKKAEEEK